MRISAAVRERSRCREAMQSTAARPVVEAFGSEPGTQLPMRRSVFPRAPMWYVKPATVDLMRIKSAAHSTSELPEERRAIVRRQSAQAFIAVNKRSGVCLETCGGASVLPQASQKFYKLITNFACNMELNGVQ